MPSYENIPQCLSEQSSPDSSLAADVVLEGGGMRGIAHAGALSVAEARGYHWRHCAGTSAGALVAALLAAGYTAAELRTLLAHIDFARFAQDQGWRGWQGAQLARLFLTGGLHTGAYLEDFLRGHLRAKGKRTFGDLICVGREDEPPHSPWRYRLMVIAADITNGRMLRLPQDMLAYGQHPDDLDIALAVRMSASIPFFYQPVLRRDQHGTLYRVVDGGLLSNFPIGIFDVAGAPAYPTFGLRLVDSPAGPALPGPARVRENLFQFSQALLKTMLTAHDRLYMDDHAYVRTIAIPVNGISGIQFDLSRTQIEQLYRNGENAAERFFSSWNFPAYVTAYRCPGSASGGRQERLHAGMCRARSWPS
jgi:NTE family protein